MKYTYTFRTIPCGLILFVCFLFSSCQKELNEPVIVPSIKTALTVEGIVTGPNGIPLQNVMVKAGNQVVMTDVNGSFRASNASFITNETFVLASKPGYFTGSRTFLPRSNSNNFLRIQLLPRAEAGVLSSNAGGEIQAGLVRITFPANAFATSSGTDYTGTVSVRASYIDPLSPLMNVQMPGDLRGVRANGDLRGLRSFGMVAVEMEGSSGQQVNLKTGFNAELSFEIPSGLMSTSPASIPLWYFDQPSGLWKEQGIAQKVGNRYVGNVSHFTFWNVDDPYQYVDLNMKIVNTALQGIQGARVELTSLSDSTSTFDYTDQNGFIDGFVPINTQLRRDIYNECDLLVSSTVIGPFTANTDLGNIQVGNSPNQQTITGVVKNCSGLPVSTGHVIITLPGQTVYANVVNGNFTVVFANCNPGGTATIIAVNDSTQMQSDPSSINLTTPIVNAGIFTTCAAAAVEFLTITVDGVSRTWNMAPYDLFAVEDTLSNGGFFDIYLGAYDTINGAGPNISLFRAVNANTIPIPIGITSMDIYDPLAAPNMLGDYFVANMPNQPALTQYGAVGQFMAGNFSGIFIRNFPPIVDTVTVTASFKIRRETF